MNTLRAPTPEEEAAILEKAFAFARDENIKVRIIYPSFSKSLQIQGIIKTVSRSSNVPMMPSISAVSMANLAIFGRIYIGSINFELSEKEIEAVFSVFGPMKTVQMMYDPATKRHKGYGFLEFETPDAASLAIQSMDNSELGGRFIKVGRPSNFPSDLPPGVPRPLPNRIYVGNVHELIQEDELRGIFEAFGPLKHCNLIPDSKDIKKHRGYGYVEYEAVADAINAMNSLNNFELAGRQLKVGKTVIGGPIPLGMKNTPSESTESSVIADSTPYQTGLAKVPSAVLLAAQKINANLEATKAAAPEPVVEESTVLVLIDLVDIVELDDPQNEEDLVLDIADECSKFGRLAEPVKIHAIHERQLVCAFVRYESLDSCQEAIARMHGRWFGGRQLTAKTYPLDLFHARNFNYI